jgi:tetratricopeptide (TPR) repeat protein
MAGRGRGIRAVMVWRRVQDWWQRRSALTELRDLTRDQEARLLDRNDNPLRCAADFVSRNNIAAAAEHWELARALLPNALVEANESLDILCGIKHFDEAEALMRERQKRFPTDRFPMEGLAKIAETRGDLETALERWQAVRDRASEHAHGYYGCARCLLALGRLDEAEVECDKSIRRGPEQLDAWVVRGLASDRRKEWEESIARWTKLTESHRFTPGFARAANAMMQLGRIDEAEVYLAEPARLYGGDLEISVTHAQLAQRRGDLTAACERWAVVRRGNLDFQAGYFDGARCLIEAQRYDEADALLREAIERFPDQIWPSRDHARVAHSRGDTSQAAIRWASFHKRFPGEDTGFTPDEAALKAIGG